VKLCTVWSADSRDTDNRPVRDPGSVTYTAAIESAATLDTDDAPAAFTQRVLREATRRRFTAAERTVVLGDGAPWIWKIAQELFPRAIQIVDRFHVKQHLSDVATAIYGPESTQAHEWAQRCHEELDSCRLSGRFQDFWERRNDRRRAV
jgi:transposase